MREIEIEGYKSIPLDILKHFADFCDSHEISYYLAYGTLLGAIRHKGYIPWDDDIDVFMMRKDYELFRKLYQSERYPFVDLLLDKHHPVGMGKLYDSHTIIRTYDKIYRKYGLFVDIFPLDTVPCDDRERKRWIDNVRKYLRLNSILNSSYGNDGKTGFFKRVASRILTRLPLSSLLHSHIEKLYTKYNNNDTGYVGVPIFKNNLKFPIQLFDSFQIVEFENYSFKVMSGFDEVLQLCYGDYMQLPPVEKRIGIHKITAFYKD